MYDPEKKPRVLCWFSCGAASAVATKLAIAEVRGKYPVEVLYNPTGAEHPDNERFLKDCEEWFGQKVIRLASPKYKDIWDVFAKTRYLVGVGGARCTAELKRKPAESYVNHMTDIEVFGFTSEEAKRAEKYQTNNPERRLYPILIEKGLSKSDCLAMIERAGIEIPTMYKLGYNNNNCIGCVKGQSGYWNKVRVDFPEVFARMAGVERELDVAINKSYKGDGKRKRVFLDELDPKAGHDVKPIPMSCGIMCESAEDLIEYCED